jgi:homeobox protein cut-like
LKRAVKNSSVVISSESEEVYERQYEDRLDPFASFSRRERQRKLAQLGPFERITYSMVQYYPH